MVEEKQEGVYFAPPPPGKIGLTQISLIATDLAYTTSVKPGFHYRANATTTTQKQGDYKFEQLSFTLIALF